MMYALWIAQGLTVPDFWAVFATLNPINPYVSVVVLPLSLYNIALARSHTFWHAPLPATGSSLAVSP
jgi:hypothetical protein